ncbi:MAG: glycosyltransferase [Byssovorax sp.]
MRVTLIAPGSRGDIEPYLALGGGLARAGHTVRVVTTMDHDVLVRERGFELFSIPVSVERALQARDASASIEGGGVVASFKQFAEIARRAAQHMAEQSLEAGAGADLLVTGFSGAFMAEGVAARLGIPLVQAYNVPLTPTAAFSGALVPGLDLGPRSRLLGHRLTRVAMWTTARMSGNAARMAVLGMPSAPRLPADRPGLVDGPVIYGVSEALLPRGPEWSPDVTVTGFWFTDIPAGYAPPPALVDFLDAGPPPVCIGFGSMSQRDPEATTALVLEAVKQAGVRAVLLAGWGGLGAGDLPREIFALPGAPHGWLYPRCSAVVHHGGAGTTAAALRAGVPAIVVPFHGDQPFWAQRVHAAGAGPAPIPRTKLTAARLASALREATERAELASAARALGAQIRAEDGVGRAVERIEQLAR